MARVRGGAAAIRKRYASSAPVIGIPDDLSGVARAASPMARSEMDARSKIGYGSGLSIDRPPGGIPSTFREGRGELIDRLIPRKKSGMLAFYTGALFLAAAVVVMFVSRGGGNKQPLPAAPVRAAPERGAHQLQLRSRRRDRRCAVTARRWA